MKKNVWFAIVIMFLINGLFMVDCGAVMKLSRGEAKQVIGRSAAVIMTAQRFAGQGQRYEGLGLSVAHQVFAVELFRRGFYPEAAYHSLRARVLAARVISQNRSNMLNEALFDRMEGKYAQDAPSDAELDQQLRDSRVEILPDRAAASGQMGLDVN